MIRVICTLRLACRASHRIGFIPCRCLHSRLLHFLRVDHVKITETDRIVAIFWNSTVYGHEVLSPLGVLKLHFAGELWPPTNSCAGLTCLWVWWALGTERREDIARHTKWRSGMKWTAS